MPNDRYDEGPWHWGVDQVKTITVSGLKSGHTYTLESLTLRVKEYSRLVIAPPNEWHNDRLNDQYTRYPAGVAGTEAAPIMYAVDRLAFIDVDGRIGYELPSTIWAYADGVGAQDGCCIQSAGFPTIGDIATYIQPEDVNGMLTISVGAGLDDLRNSDRPLACLDDGVYDISGAQVITGRLRCDWIRNYPLNLSLELTYAKVFRGQAGGIIFDQHGPVEGATVQSATVVADLPSGLAALGSSSTSEPSGPNGAWESGELNAYMDAVIPDGVQTWFSVGVE
jgi:hypothetical protein